MSGHRLRRQGPSWILSKHIYRAYLTHFCINPKMLTEKKNNPTFLPEAWTRRRGDVGKVFSASSGKASISDLFMTSLDIVRHDVN